MHSPEPVPALGIGIASRCTWCALVPSGIARHEILAMGSRSEAMHGQVWQEQMGQRSHDPDASVLSA